MDQFCLPQCLIILRDRDTPAMLREIEALQAERPNVTIQALSARRYLDEWGVECLSPARATVSDCGERIIEGDNIEVLSTGHACMGPSGGTADLLSWDVSEFLHQN